MTEKLTGRNSDNSPAVVRNHERGRTRCDVLIIGGGFSGSILAAQLLRHSSKLSVGVIDRGELPGRGVAYRSSYRFHLLNVPAGEMSAWPDRPDHFLQWARANFHSELLERSFPPRSIYGKYVEQVLDDALAEHGRDRLHWIRGEALSLRRRHRDFVVTTEDKSEVSARAVVLATGNFPPASPKVRGLEKSMASYFEFPWAPGVLDDLPSAGSILLLGSGLTSLDLMMALKSKGYRGTIRVLSRTGLLPRPRRQLRPVETWPMFWTKRSPRTVRGLLRLVRRQVRAAAKKGVDWRAVIDSLRPVTQQIWQSLAAEEQRRFLRHVRSFWDVHRHRSPPEIADLLADMQAEGQIQLHSGFLVECTESSDGMKIIYWDRDTKSENTLDHVARIVNCTGSETASRKIDHPLILGLIEQGHARLDNLGLGLAVDKHGRLLNKNGRALKALYSIGPLRKGTLWETTAVAEIRQQAADLGVRLAAQLEAQATTPALPAKSAGL